MRRQQNKGRDLFEEILNEIYSFMLIFFFESVGKGKSHKNFIQRQLLQTDCYELKTIICQYNSPHRSNL